MRGSLLLVSLLMAATANAGTPQINVGSMFDQLAPESSNLLKRVRNSGDATAFVRIELAELHYGADGTHSESAIDAAALSRNEAGAHGLIASPARMIIPAAGQQATRLVYRGPREQERYYRVRFIPVVPDTTQFALSEQELADYRQTLSASVNVFTGYGALLFVPPADARYDTVVTATASGHRLDNRGNATVTLENVRECSREARSERCGNRTMVHLRPGQSHVLSPASGHFNRLDLIEGESSRHIDLRD